MGGVLPLCRDAVGVFYSPSRLGNIIVGTVSAWNLFANVLIIVELKKFFFSFWESLEAAIIFVQRKKMFIAFTIISLLSAPLIVAE